MAGHHSSCPTVPAMSIDTALPWFTGVPYALYAHVRAITPNGTTKWSSAFGFNIRWTNIPKPIDSAARPRPLDAGRRRDRIPGLVHGHANTPLVRRTRTSPTSASTTRSTPTRRWTADRPLARARGAAGVRHDPERPARRLVRPVEPCLHRRRTRRSARPAGAAGWRSRTRSATAHEAVGARADARAHVHGHEHRRPAVRALPRLRLHRPATASTSSSVAPSSAAPHTRRACPARSSCRRRDTELQLRAHERSCRAATAEGPTFGADGAEDHHERGGGGRDRCTGSTTRPRPRSSGSTSTDDAAPQPARRSTCLTSTSPPRATTGRRTGRADGGRQRRAQVLRRRGAAGRLRRRTPCELRQGERSRDDHGRHAVRLGAVAAAAGSSPRSRTSPSSTARRSSRGSRRSARPSTRCSGRGRSIRGGRPGSKADLRDVDGAQPQARALVLPGPRAQRRRSCAVPFMSWSTPVQVTVAQPTFRILASN